MSSNDLDTKPGYKKTKLGCLPEDWKLEKLGELFEFRNGVNANKEDYGQGIKFVNVMDVLENTFITENKILGSVQLTKKQIEKNLIKKGDVLFNRTSETQNEIGLTALYNDDVDAVFGGFVIRGRPKNNSLNHLYNGYSFQSELVRKQIISKGQGAVRVNIGQLDLEQVLLPIPLLSEQKKIAEILSTWDEAIQKTEALIEKKEKLKKGLMQQLLYPKDNWETYQIKELFTFHRSISASRKDLVSESESNDILNIHYGDVHTLFNDAIQLDISESDKLNAFVSEFKLPSKVDYAKDGDVIIVDASEDYDGVAECFELTNIGEKTVTAGLHTFLLRPKAQKTVSGFRSLIFKAPINRKEIKRLVTGSNVFGLSKTNLSKLEVSIPPKEEQEKIVSVLSFAEREIDDLIKLKEQQECQKKGLMQQLLTGKTRVTVN